MSKIVKAKHVIACIMAAPIVLMGCSNSDEGGVNCADTAWTQLVSTEIAAYSAALSTYSNDPSAANCNAVKSTAIDYLEALRDALDCVPTANRAEVNSAINEAQDEVNDEDCD